MGVSKLSAKVFLKVNYFFNFGCVSWPYGTIKHFCGVVEA